MTSQNNQSHNISDHLLESISKIKNRYHHQINIDIQSIAQPTSHQDRLEKLSIVIQMISEENRYLYKGMQELERKLISKEEEIEIRNQMVKKYRQQLKQEREKNVQLENYSRKIASEYNILLNSIKNKQSINQQRNLSNLSKLSSLQQKLRFLQKHQSQTKNYKENIQTIKTQFSPQKTEKKKLPKKNNSSKIKTNISRRSSFYTNK